MADERADALAAELQAARQALAAARADHAQLQAGNEQLRAEHQALQVKYEQTRLWLEELDARHRAAETRTLRGRAADAALYLFGRLALGLQGWVERCRAAAGPRSRALVEKVQAFIRWVAFPPRPALPRVTIVTPVLNMRAHIAECLESVLYQDYPDLEYIVVDGGSTDGTLEVIREYAARTDLPHRIARVVSEPDAGLYDAVGKGFDLATGEVLGYLNADDLLEAGGVLQVGRFFAGRPRADVVYHEDTVLVMGWKYANYAQPRRITTARLLRGHILYQAGVFFRRRLYDAVGGVRRDLRLAGDYDLWLRMSARARFVRNDAHVSAFRVRPGQLSERMDAYRAEMARATRDALRAAPIGRAIRLALARLAALVLPAAVRRPLRGRLAFGIDFDNMGVPTGIAVAPSPQPPASPIDGAAPERFMMSVAGVRGGHYEQAWEYLDTRHGIAIAWPGGDDAERAGRFHRLRSTSAEGDVPPPPGLSPFARVDRRRLWHKFLFRLPLERLARVPLRELDDPGVRQAYAALQRAGVDVQRPLRVLACACFDGALLDWMRANTPWRAAGLEPDEGLLAQVQAKGHVAWRGRPEEALEKVPAGELFDVILLRDALEHSHEPLALVRRLRQLLRPGGVLVALAPNLDSYLLRWYGPAWMHWDAPFHRYTFSPAGLRALAVHAGLVIRDLRTYSSPLWGAMTLVHAHHAERTIVDRGYELDAATRTYARRMDFWARAWWDRRERGDFMVAVLAEAAHG